MASILDQLLAPVSEEDPAGPDLAYDLERHEIEQAFESSVGGADEDASDPVDWRAILRLIEAQSARTKDVWLAVYLCRAGARSGQIAVVETGALYLAGLFDRFWDVVHPKLDEYGFQGRKGPCDSLARIGEFLAPLKRAPLLEHPRLGQFSGADFERFRANAEAEEGYGLFRAALQDTPEAALVEIVERLDRIATAIRGVDAILTARAEGDTGTNFAPTYEVLAEMKRSVQSFTTAPAAEEEAGAGAEESAADGRGDGGGARIAGRVESRDDVLRALDAIADYYRRKEPTSPVPLALQRAREWVTADFMSILQDIVPDSISDARRVLVSNREE